MEEETFDVDEEACGDEARLRALKEQSPSHVNSLSARRATEGFGNSPSSASVSVVQQPVLTSASGENVFREERWLTSQGSLQKIFSPPFSRRADNERQHGKVVVSPSVKNSKLSEQVAKFPQVALSTSPKEIEEADLLFVPDDDQEWQRPRRPPGSGGGPSKQLTGPIISAPPALPAKPEAQHEDEEWLERKRVTGVIGRLVQYQSNEVPDKAVLSGVRGPATLIFLGFSGKLQAEVRVKQPDEPRLGLPAQVSVSSKVLQKSKRDEDRRRRWVEAQKPPAPPSLHLLDPVVFERSSGSSLLIATEGVAKEVRPEAETDTAGARPSRQQGVYELHQQDAREILYQALRPQVMTVAEDYPPRQHRVSSRDSDVVNF